MIEYNHIVYVHLGVLGLCVIELTNPFTHTHTHKTHTYTHKHTHTQTHVYIHTCIGVIC